MTAEQPRATVGCKPCFTGLPSTKTQDSLSAYFIIEQRGTQRCKENSVTVKHISEKNNNKKENPVPFKRECRQSCFPPTTEREKERWRIRKREREN